MHIISNADARNIRAQSSSETPHYAPPRQLTALVERPALVRELTARIGKLTVLLGLPGSGKTTLLAASHAQLLATGSPAAWLSLSAAHDDPQLLCAHLQQAFKIAGPVRADAPPRVPSGITGFIDGLDRLTSPAALALIESFLLSVPDDARMIATSVQLRGAALHDGRMRGLVHVIGPDCLRMQRSEAALLLGNQYSDAQVDRINRIVDGWIAGLHFFKEDIHQTGVSDNEWILPVAMIDYFDEVVRPRFDPNIFEVLAQLAVLDRFTPKLLHALPEPPCSWTVVEEQIRVGFFLGYTSPSREWAAFHPAFGQYLRRFLRFSNPDQHDRINQFAATWFEQHGYGAEAVRHAVVLPDAPQAARIIEKVGSIDINLGQGPGAALSQYLPPSRAGELPLLFLAQTYQRIRHGRLRQAETVFEQASTITDGFTRLEADSDPSVVKAWARTLSVVFLSTNDRPVSAIDATLLENEMKQHQDQNPELAGSIASVLAFIYMDIARFEQATAICDAGLAAQPQPLSSKAVMWIRLHQADAMIARHNVGQAQKCVDHAWQLAHIDSCPESYEVLTTQLTRGIVLYEDDQQDAALALIEPALERIRTINGWLRLYAQSYATAAAIVGYRSGWQAAEHIIRAGEQFAQERDLPRLKQFMAIARLRELTRAGEWQAAKAILESESLTALIESDDSSIRVRVQQLPALLEAAHLMLQLGQPREALRLLQRIDRDFIAEGENRLRLRYHVLMMRSQHAQRRTAAAITHLNSAVEIARSSGLRRAIREDAHHLIDTHAALSSNHRTIPANTQRYISEVLQLAPRTSESVDISAVRPLLKNDADCALSPRESQIMALLAQGMINKEIAHHLGISEGTVKTHRKKTHEKLGVSSRSQAIARARELLII